MATTLLRPGGTTDWPTKVPSELLFFFFSSRRRHTRWTGDWSSDVCSSDLRGAAARPAHQLHGAHGGGQDALPGLFVQDDAPRSRALRRGVFRMRAVHIEAASVGQYLVERSEERRVGKECRCGESA